MKIILARHGETAWNAEGRYQGQADIPLSATGEAQARALGARLHDIEITRAVADAVGVPVVASGGAGSPEHLYRAMTDGGASAALAASIFHYGTYTIEETKRYLAERGVPVRFEPVLA